MTTWLHNMSAPPRTQVTSLQKPVWGRVTVFSLAHALLAQGLLDTAPRARAARLVANAAVPARASAPTSMATREEIARYGPVPSSLRAALVRKAQRRWKGSIERLLASATRAGCLDRALLDSAPCAADAAGQHGASRCRPSGVLMGWFPPEDWAPGDVWAPCADLALTLAVLERRVGALSIASRAPDRTWRHLFEADLAVDDPRFLTAQVRTRRRRAAAAPKPHPGARQPEGTP